MENYKKLANVKAELAEIATIYKKGSVRSSLVHELYTKENQVMDSFLTGIRTHASVGGDISAEMFAEVLEVVAGTTFRNGIAFDHLVNLADEVGLLERFYDQLSTL